MEKHIDETTVSDSPSRRRFLRNSLALGAGVAAQASMGMPLAQAADAVPAQRDISGFKAIIHIQLPGGNDGHSMIVPYAGEEYGEYKYLRPVLAFAQSELTPIEMKISSLSGGRRLAVPTRYMKSLLDTFQVHDSGLAIMANVGTLAVPLTLDECRTASKPFPPGLAAHNIQGALWSGIAPRTAHDSGPRTAWGGRLAELFAASNTGRVSMTYAMGDSAGFLVGPNERQDPKLYPLGYGLLGNSFKSANESLPRNRGGDTVGADMVRRLVGTTNERRDLDDNVLGKEYARLLRESSQSSRFFSDALNSVSESDKLWIKGEFTRLAPGGGCTLDDVLKVMLAQRALGQTRQMFYVIPGVGSFDRHNAGMDDNAQRKSVMDAIAAFMSAAKHFGLDKNVIGFTTSEFGRKMVSNSVGSDHGWGSHHVIFGDVKGGNIYGNYNNVEDRSDPLRPTKLDPFPVVTSEKTGSVNTWDIGCYMPTTSCEQMFGPIAKWFGATDADLKVALPSIDQFNLPTAENSFIRNT